MRFFFDTEFIESGYGSAIWPLSIGMVSEGGGEFYAEIEQPPSVMALANDFVRESVLPHLTGSQLVRTPTDLATLIQHFVGDTKPEFWAHYADYDWVVLCQLFGRMADLPVGWPMLCMDVRQLRASLGDPPVVRQQGDEHHALADARHVKVMYDSLSGR